VVLGKAQFTEHPDDTLFPSEGNEQEVQIFSFILSFFFGIEVQYKIM
jgi:hypothetical protein